jgi:hypothetical protein
MQTTKPNNLFVANAAERISQQQATSNKQQATSNKQQPNNQQQPTNKQPNNTALSTCLTYKIRHNHSNNVECRCGGP